MVFEPGSAGDSTIDVARGLAEDEGAEVTVVGVVPEEIGAYRCGVSPHDYRAAVADSVAHDLDQAAARLGEAAERATWSVLIDRADAPLERLCQAGDFDLILLPARRRLLRAAGHPAAARLSRAGRGEVRVIAP